MSSLALERPARTARLRVAVVLAAVLVAVLLAALAIPDARSALARFFHIGAARIEVVDELPAVEPQPPELDLELALGERVSLAEARRRAGYDLLELDEAPDRVYLGPRDSVWFLYGRPDAVRLLVAQTPKLSLDEDFILKKLAAAGHEVEPATVRGRPAYFLSGERARGAARRRVRPRRRRRALRLARRTFSSGRRTAARCGSRATSRATRRSRSPSRCAEPRRVRPRG